MKLYGTLTSPYVRRVRVVAHLAGASLEIVDTATEAGQAELRDASPLWKVPTFDTGDGLVLYDSRVIVEWLAERHDRPELSGPGSGEGRWARQNLLTSIDGALDSAINGFYLGRDGATREALPYFAKQLDRVGSAMAAVASAVEAGIVSASGPVGAAHINLVTTLEWMRFRKTYDVDAHPALVAFLASVEAQPAFVQTRIPGYAP